MQEQNDAIEFLKQANVAILATNGPGGRPHVAPVWYIYDGDEFVISTGLGSQKHRNVERDGNVSLVADRRTVPYYAVTVQGTAEIGPPPSHDLRLQLAVRYLGEERGRAYTARRSGAESVTIRIRPEKIIEYRGEAAREDA